MIFQFKIKKIVNTSNLVCCFLILIAPLVRASKTTSFVFPGHTFQLSPVWRYFNFFLKNEIGSLFQGLKIIKNGRNGSRNNIFEFCLDHCIEDQKIHLLCPWVFPFNSPPFSRYFTFPSKITFFFIKNIKIHGKKIHVYRTPLSDPVAQ